ncbi:MAG: hypothetical protein EH225_12380 [Calditrichaeota bacterium]|nr:MAG: hypothetical protein EH225_12380 [Calditrichota bacterium]
MSKYCSASGKIVVLSGLFLVLLSRASENYFQQEVKYHIQARLLNSLNRLECSENLMYYNNSPDSLSFLYFHLYVNRYQPSYLENRNVPRTFGYQEIISIHDDNQQEVNYQISGTVMKVWLNRILGPGDSARLIIRFNTVLPEYGERFGYYGDHFDVGNWYPVPAVYDRQGWHADQHEDGEFYQEWGSFLVEITVPAGFVVGATGILLNEEVLPDSIEYAERRKYYAEPQDTSMVTYIFRADHVHDFAWAADPEFVMRKTRVDETELIFFILPYRLQEWERQLDIAARAVSIFNREIGLYPYQTLTVVDGYIRAGGIEYPNIVIINDIIDDPRELSATIIHEISHQWFYGLLANNQTRYGWMDEGFATYYENLAMTAVFGSDNEFVNSPGGFWGSLFGYWRRRAEMDKLNYLQYIRSGNEEPINRHFDWFRDEPWIPYYQKMSLVISQLKYLVGDSLFEAAIQNYFHEWKFRHPYPEDFYSVFEKISNRKLDWFFYQWLNTTWHCDYGIDRISGKWIDLENEKKYRVRAEFSRKRSIAMPLDFRVFFTDQKFLDYRIPLDDGMNFTPVDSGNISAWPHRVGTRTVELLFPDKISKIQLNPEGKLLDVNPFNDDVSPWPRIHWYWLKRQYYFPHTDGYTATVFPFVFYNNPDGAQVGIRTRGNYIYPDYQHRLQLIFGLKSLKPAGEFWFEHPVYKLNRDLHFITTLHDEAGRRGTGLWFQWMHEEGKKLTGITAGGQYRYVYNLDYYPYPAAKGHISFMEIALRKGAWEIGYLPTGWELNARVETAFPGSDFNFQTLEVDALMRMNLFFHQKLTLLLRSGNSYGEVPIQKAFRLGGARSYELCRNPYLRSKGILPDEWWKNGNIFEQGGGNLRSLAYSLEPAKSHLVNGFASITLGNPLNLSYTYIPYLSDIELSAFTSWTLSSDNWRKHTDMFGEAGFIVSLMRLPFLFNYIDIRAVHFDFPIWVNNKIDSENIDLRWAIRFDIRSFH